jgi:hypothetical protein
MSYDPESLSGRVLDAKQQLTLEVQNGAQREIVRQQEILEAQQKLRVQQKRQEVINREIARLAYEHARPERRKHAAKLRKQQAIANIMRGAAQEVAQLLISEGVVPASGSDDSYIIKRLVDPGGQYPYGVMPVRGRRPKWPPPPPIERVVSIWPLRVKKSDQEAITGALGHYVAHSTEAGGDESGYVGGTPGYAGRHTSSGIGMICADGELVNFYDTWLMHTERPGHYQTYGREHRSPVTATDLAPEDSIVEELAPEEQPLVAEWRECLTEFAGSQLAGIRFFPG